MGKLIVAGVVELVDARDFMEKIYEKIKMYGPYLSKLDNRLRLVYRKNGRKTTISYPKYLMEISLNRYLTETETVQHLDGNPLNNDLSNLIVLNRTEHGKIDAKRVKDVIFTCQWCKKEFLVKGSTLHSRLRKDRQSNSFCSKSCVGKYGVSIQKGGPKFNRIELERKYYVERDIRNSITGEQNIGEGLTANTEA